jgi:hypothetical protein
VAFDLIDELEGIVDAFERERVSYALCGGLALGFHGFVRATKDIDVLVSESELARAMEIARALGFDVPARKITFGLRTATPREVQRVSKLDPDTGELLTLDLMVVSPDLEDVWQTRITIAPAPGKQLVIVSREGLAKMKRIAGRPQDLVDLARLEGVDDDEQA